MSLINGISVVLLDILICANMCTKLLVSFQATERARADRERNRADAEAEAKVCTLLFFIIFAL